MKRHYFIIIAFTFLMGVATSHAETQFIWWGAQDEIYLRVGVGAAIETVIYNVPLANIGDGTPIQGVPANIEIVVHARRSSPMGWGSLRYSITADSSTPLTNGPYTIPFTDISWTSQDGDIPAGTFSGAPGQVILGPTRVFWLTRDWLTFSYSNVRVVASGTYTGRITYTAAIP